MANQKKTLGRRKIEMKQIPCKQARLVSFSKRRAGLYKKASELCTSTGCEIAIIIFTPSDKLHSFGNPSVETVVQRFLNGRTMLVPPNERARGSVTSDLSQVYADLSKQLEAEKKKGKELAEKIREKWEIEEMALEQLVQAKKSLEELKCKLAKTAGKFSAEGSSSTFSPKGNVRDFDLNVVPSGDEI